MSGFPIPLAQMPVLIRIVVVALTLSLISQQAQLIADLDVRDGDWWHNLNQIGLFWVTLLAPGFYLCAVWATAGLIGRINRGDAFGPAMVRGLRDIGSNLMWGAAAAVVIQPSLTVWIEERFRGFRYDADIASITIGLLGLVLWLIAARGEQMKSEIDSFI